MLMDGEWGGYVELVAFSEFYNIQIQVYDSLGSQQPKTTVLTADGRVTIVILFRVPLDRLISDFMKKRI